jgi:hypothetical protein
MAYELHQAAERGQLGELVKLLVLGVADQAADIHAKNEAGETPIHCAVRSGHIETIIYLLCHGADVNAKVESTADRPAGETPLHMACSVGNAQIARHFLVSGADVNAKTNFNSAGLGGDTPLHLACAFGFLEVSRLLLNSGADPNAANRSGWTPLHIATTNGHLKIAQELVSRGANPIHLCDADNVLTEAKQIPGPTPETATVSLPQLGGGTPPTPQEQQPSPMSSGEARAGTEGRPEGKEHAITMNIRTQPAPKPRKIWVAKLNSPPTAEENGMALRGFFHMYPKVEEADLLEGVPLGQIYTIGTAHEHCDCALRTIFKDNAYPTSYYLDAVLVDQNNSPIFVVMLWDGDSARLAQQYFPGGKWH